MNRQAFANYYRRESGRLLADCMMFRDARQHDQAATFWLAAKAYAGMYRKIMQAGAPGDHISSVTIAKILGER